MSTTQKSGQQSWLQYMKRPKRGVPEGLWLRCDGCGATVFRNQVEENLNVCPECDHHFYVHWDLPIESATGIALLPNKKRPA